MVFVLSYSRLSNVVTENPHCVFAGCSIQLFTSVFLAHRTWTVFSKLRFGRNRDSSVCIATDYRLNDRGSIVKMIDLEMLMHLNVFCSPRTEKWFLEYCLS